MIAGRRSFLAGLVASPLGGTPSRARQPREQPPRVAITIDDFDLSDATMIEGEARDLRIRKVLARHGVKAAGFVAGKHVDDPRGRRVLQAWSDAGHLLGNHSYAHRRFVDQSPQVLMEDILRCETLLAGYEGFVRLFRFPYLAEGETVDARDVMRGLLRRNGYRNGHVTIDTSDWFIDGRLRARLRSDPEVDIGPFRRFYLDHVWERATYYDRLARRVFRRPIPHTLLLHHRLTTALFLDDLLTLFAARGWRVANAGDVFATADFALEPDSLPAGQSLVWAAAKASGRFESELRFPGEDGRYEEARADKMHL